MKQLSKFVRSCFQNWPRDYLVCHLVVIGVLGVLGLVVFTPGCARSFHYCICNTLRANRLS
jgi:hypothetical protein